MSFEQILDFIRSQHELIIYGILMMSAYIENIIPPFPGDAVVLSGAYLAGEGNITYIGVLLSATAGGTLGAMTLYYVGLKRGRRFFETGKGRYLIKGNLGKVEELFRKRGSIIILLSRFMPGIRSVVAVSAGIAEYPAPRMWVVAPVSFLLWYGLLNGLMIYSKSNWRQIVELVKQYNIVLLTIGVLILIGWLIRSVWIRRNLK